MPTYEYRHPFEDKVIERNVPIDERDNQYCDGPECGQKLKRIISFTGLTWAPTAGGMR